MSTFIFLTCKSIFHLLEHHKFEYFPQPWWKIYVLFMLKQCIYLVIQMYFMQIFFHLLSSANKLTDLFVFPIFLFTLHATRTIKRSEILRKFRVKIRPNFKANDISITISSNLLYFNFTKLR